mmetsp:Transcript_54109/g.60410  ORF Transcript_54109/g.60410 Transcript_54109/m.60410 type:complete len:724 (-) Transcript_54109:9-2180(-)
MNEDGINHKNKNSPQKSSRIRQRQRQRQRQTKKVISSSDNTIIRDKTKNQKRTRTRIVERFCYLSFLLTFISCMTSLLVFFVATIEQHEHDSTHHNIPLTSSSLSSSSLSLSSVSVASRLELESMQKNNTKLLIKDDNKTNESRSHRRSTFNHNNNSNNSNVVLYPYWIIQYVEWHQEQRRKFPGEELFTNPKAPKLLVRTCLGLCGGLHDRLGQLPWDLYLANKLNRVLLIAWQRPKSLEHFLIPPIPILPQNKKQDTNERNHHHRLYIDWTIPPSQQFGFDDIRRVRSDVLELFEGYNEANPGEDRFWKSGFRHSLVRAGVEKQSGRSNTYVSETKYADAKILRHRLLGHLDEEVLETLLEKEGYYDMDKKNRKRNDDNTKTYTHTPQQLHETPTFGNIWNLFFRPSVDVRREIISSLKEMNLLSVSSSGGPPEVDVIMHSNDDNVDPISLLPRTVSAAAGAVVSASSSSSSSSTQYYIQNYTGVHCRVRHPKAHLKGKTTIGKDDKHPADKTGLPWVDPGGAERQFAIETAYKALQCATDIATTLPTNKNNEHNKNNMQQQQQPIYFLSDSNDLVKHVSIELYDDKTPHGYLHTHHQNNNTIQSIYPPLFQLIRNNNNSNNQQKNYHYVRARNVTIENAHIDRQKGRPPPAYYGTFIDLYITMNANCVVYGIGYYAAFAAKISGVPCTYLYAEESWGIQKEKNAQLCPSPSSSSSSLNQN